VAFVTQNQTAMTLWYWRQVGGTLIEEFLAVPRGEDQAPRRLDGLIILGEKRKRLSPGAPFNLRDKDVIVVQTENGRLGMYLMGQVLFSQKLIERRHKPRSVQSIALCAKSDRVLQPMLEAYKGCKVKVCPSKVCGVKTTPKTRLRLGRNQPSLLETGG
jgi:hypothetical protein